MLCAYVALKMIVLADLKGKPIRVWLVAPTYDLAGKVFNYLVKWYQVLAPSQRNFSFRPPQKMRTARGSIVECKSATEPNSLLGESVDLLVVDECSRIARNIYEQYLSPTTIDNPNSRIFYISTPFGRNWFYEYWVRANETAKQEAFHFASKDNPYLPEGFWEEQRKRLPKDVFQQEYAADFLQGGGTVFRGVRKIIDISLEGGKERFLSHRYVMGLDVAKFGDFTVAVVIDRDTHEIVAFDRFQKLPYGLQKERIVKLAEAYRAKVIIDSSQMGAAMADDLRSYGLIVKDFKFVGTTSRDWKKRGSKERLIEKLSSFIEEENIKIPPERSLIDELEAFSYHLTERGNFRYEAPYGINDDCVDALALAVWDLKPKRREENAKIKRSFPKQTKSFQYL